jgi:prolyl oligopeptidase
VPSSSLRRRYPSAARLNLVQESHGQRVPDPYRWLEDPADRGTRRWTAEQELLYQSERATWDDRPRWESRLRELMAAGLVLAPKIRGDQIFWRQLDAGRDHPALYVMQDGAARLLLDVQAEDPTGQTVLEAWEPSAEGDLLAYQLSAGGSEDSLLQVLDVASGQVVDGPIDRVRRTSVGWLPGGRMFYYVGRLAAALHPGEERYHRRVYLHEVGQDRSEDIAVFGDGRDKTQFYSVAVTSDGRWLTITATTGTSPDTDVYLADLSASSPARPRLRAVQEGADGRTRVHIAPGTGPDDTIWLHTDRDAPRGRVVACRPGDPGPGAWRELIGERPDAVLADLAVMTGPELARPVGLVTWTRHATSEITVHDLADGRQLGTVPLPGLGSVNAISVRPGGGPDAWVSYTDHVTLPRVLRYDARDGRLEPWPGPGRRGGVSGVTTVRVAFPSRDGTTVRMFIMSPAGRPDVARPAILTGYGGFGTSMQPGFSPDAVAWVQAGGVFAIACLRGGGEEGARWHRDGQRERKQNVFDDFDAAAGYLARVGWARADQLGIMGASNGGLLVGASLTQHPERYAAAACLVPLLDMARYELSGLGPSWVPEYGSAADPAGLRALLAYSPYHHVVPGTAYPPVLLAAAEADTRVDPLHARKMCAALQHASSGPGPVLLRLERGVGHGARALSRAISLQADCLAFLGRHLGLALPAETP